MSTSRTIRDHTHKKFEIDRTKIKDGCQSRRKGVPHNSKSFLPQTTNKKDFTMKTVFHKQHESVPYVCLSSLSHMVVFPIYDSVPYVSLSHTYIPPTPEGREKGCQNWPIYDYRFISHFFSSMYWFTYI